MNEELIQINKQILLKGLFAMNFPQHINELELNQELDELEKKGVLFNLLECLVTIIKKRRIRTKKN